MSTSSKDYVKWFRNSAPYINAHRGKTFVLMFGGEAVEHANFANIIHDIALLNSLGVRLVLVHGARPQIDERVLLRDKTSTYHNNVRITDSVTLDCVKDAVGSLRTQIEALLTMGLANSPMHGAQIRIRSGNYVTARPLGVLEGVDFQHTGVVRRIDAEGIHQQLSEGAIVLLSSLGYSTTGEVFNLSMEHVAAQAAKALAADKLIVLSANEGLFENDQLLRSCELSKVKHLLSECEDAVTARELQAIIESYGSVTRCQMISYADDGALLQELFTRDGSGTLVAQDHYEQLRTATIDDVGGILEIIEPLEANGALVKRSRELLETEIERFTVLERDGMVIACAALYPYPEEAMGELACIATHPDYRGSDRGERLLESLDLKARQLGLDKLFVLTTQTAHWFIEQGFIEAKTDVLPAEKKDLYNFQRNSKVFVR